MFFLTFTKRYTAVSFLYSFVELFLSKGKLTKWIGIQQREYNNQTGVREHSEVLWIRCRYHTEYDERIKDRHGGNDVNYE